ncbi:MAG: hypothetical protein IPM53_08190 [Anaerolineaceae bacterium]|nr:hypothetical protein [Anaerolineaceae bacterium]
MLFVALIIALYLYGVRQQFLHVNTNQFTIDQATYLETAKSLKTSNYTIPTDRNRMPVYPYLLSLFYDPDLSEEAFFARGKLFNIALSLLILPVLFWIFRQHLPSFTAVNLILIHIFTVYIFKAAYTQTELLFYLLNFVVFLLMCYLLHYQGRQGIWKTAVFTGILLGITHLTKASIFPGLILFLGIATFKAGVKLVKLRSGSFTFRDFLLTLSTPVLVVLFCLITIWPYIQNSKARFGSYFYNVNSTFYIWYDSWDNVLEGTRAHGDRIGWPDMPPEEIPSATKYFREHSLSQVVDRLLRGFLITLVSMANSYGYLKYMVIMFSLVLSLWLFNRSKARDILIEFPFVALFAAGFFAIYLFLYAWYTPIANGNRLVLALFSPLMFTFSFIIYRLFDKQLVVKLNRHSSKTVHLGLLLNALLTSILLVDGYIILTERVSTMYGGF